MNNTEELRNALHQASFCIRELLPGNKDAELTLGVINAALASAPAQPLAWIHEDELPEGYPYEAMFPYSKVDVVRMFPVYGPPTPAQPVVMTDADHVPDDYRNQARGYRAGWNDAIAVSAQAAPKVPECEDCALRAAGFISDEDHDRFVNALREAKAQAVPEGWRLVPEEPTEAMLRAGSDAENNDGKTYLRPAWRYMLAAAPQPPAPSEQRNVQAIADDMEGEIVHAGSLQPDAEVVLYPRSYIERLRGIRSTSGQRKPLTISLPPLPTPEGTRPSHRVVGPGGEGGTLLSSRGGDLVSAGLVPSGQYTAGQMRAYALQVLAAHGIRSTGGEHE